MSVQAQDHYPNRTAIDQRGEQSVNRDAKTAGGIKKFHSSESSNMKWTLNRAHQSANTSELKSMTAINQENFVYKSLMPSEIIKSEKKVQRIVKVLQEEYINPFSGELDKSQLYNLSSGIQVPEDAEMILRTTEDGHNEYSSFLENRLEGDSKMFHNPSREGLFQFFTVQPRK